MYGCWLANSQPYTINVGTTANDGTGDTLRSSWQKANSNTTHFVSRINTLSNSLDTVEAQVATLEDQVEAINALTNSITVNVKHFGAVGNGSTDDTAAILDAFEAVLQTGGIVHFPKGTYMTGPIDLLGYRNVTIQGENQYSEFQYVSTSVIKFNTNCATGLKLAEDDAEVPASFAAGMVVRDISLHGNSKATNVINMMRSVKLVNVKVSGAVRDGIVMEGGSYPVHLTHVVSQGNGRNGLTVKAPFTTVYTVRDSEFGLNGQHGVYVEGGSTALFENVLCQSNTGDGFHVTYLNPTNYNFSVFLERLKFLNCYAEANTGWGLYVTSYNTDPTTYTGKILDLSFDNCSFNSSVAQQVYIRGTTTPIVEGTPYVYDALVTAKDYNTLTLNGYPSPGKITAHNLIQVLNTNGNSVVKNYESTAAGRVDVLKNDGTVSIKLSADGTANWLNGGGNLGIGTNSAHSSAVVNIVNGGVPLRFERTGLDIWRLIHSSSGVSLFNETDNATRWGITEAGVVQAYNGFEASAVTVTNNLIVSGKTALGTNAVDATAWLQIANDGVPVRYIRSGVETWRSTHSSSGFGFYNEDDTSTRMLLTATGSLALPDVPLTWAGGDPTSTTADVFLRRDAANILAQRNGATAQTFRVANTFTDGSNYEVGALKWSSNILEVGVDRSGTGSDRAAIFRGYGVTLSASAPTQTTSATAGKNVTISASNATAGSSVAGAAAGGAVSITGGNAARLTSGNANGGSVTITGGNGTVGSGDGGPVTITAGDVGNVGGDGRTGGAVTITSGKGGNTGGSGSVTIQTPAYAYAANTSPGLLSIIGGNNTGTPNSGSITPGGSVAITTGTGASYVGGSSSSASNPGGSLTITLGAGGGSSATGGANNPAGNGGPFSIVGGGGGNSTGAGGTHTGGNGSLISITSGAGGNATGASGTRVGGDSGAITIGTGAVGTGASGNGTPGPIVFSIGGSEKARLNSRGNLQLTSVSVPASAAATGTAGEIAWDSDYIYMCVAANTWKRVAISTW